MRTAIYFTLQTRLKHYMSLTADLEISPDQPRQHSMYLPFLESWQIDSWDIYLSILTFFCCYCWCTLYYFKHLIGEGRTDKSVYWERPFTWHLKKQKTEVKRDWDWDRLKDRGRGEERKTDRNRMTVVLGLKCLSTEPRICCQCPLTLPRKYILHSSGCCLQWKLREKLICSVKAIRADEIVHQKASIVHFTHRSLQIGIY